MITPEMQRCPRGNEGTSINTATSTATAILRNAGPGPELRAAALRRRATAYRLALPMTGDFHGNSTELDREAARRRNLTNAELLELHARLVEAGYFDSVEAELPHDVTGASYLPCPACGGTGEVPSDSEAVAAR